LKRPAVLPEVGGGTGPAPAVILGRADGIWACTLAREWQKRGVPTVIVSTVVHGPLPSDIPVVIVRWSDRPWVARLRRAAYPLMTWLQRWLVRRGTARFAAVAGAASPDRWEYDFIEPFWNALLLSRAASRLHPRFVLGQEVHSHGLATALCRGPRYLFPWGSDVFTVIETSFPMKAMVTWALRRADLIVPTAATATGYLSSRFRISPSRIRPLSWGVDLRLFRPTPAADKAALRRRLGLPPEAKIVINARRFLPQWQSDTVLEAFIDCARRRADAHLVMIGGLYAEGEVAQARQRIASAGLASRFTFAGDLQLPDYRDHLSAADVFVSMNPRFDMRSVSVLQGLACGLVPVLSEHPEYRAMQAAGFDAVFVPARDADALSEAIRVVLADPARFGPMVVGNERYVAEHEDGERQMGRLLDLLLYSADSLDLRRDSASEGPGPPGARRN